jgi:DNA modification methylase
VAVFREVRRVLRDDGTVWLNLGDAYASSPASGGERIGRPQDKNPGTHQRTPKLPWKRPDGLKPKDLIGMPWMVAFALRADGWYLRSDIIWSKPNPMPESVRDRPTSAHEHVFLLTKRPRYFYDADAVRTPALSDRPDMAEKGLRTGGAYLNGNKDNAAKPDKQRGHGRRHDGFNDRWDAMPKTEQQAMGANLRNVWTIATHAFPDAHFATFPPALVEPCIKAGTSEKGCCGSCGSPWVRRTDVERGGPSTRGDRKNAGTRFCEGFAFKGGGSPTGIVAGSDTRGMPSLATTTTGWAPTCTCDADVVPCQVLDPFGGAGTTGLVADRLGRDAVLIDLSSEYAEMAERRIRGDAPLFVNVQVRP